MLFKYIEMIFLDVKENEMENVETLQRKLDSKKDVFILVYMNGCLPCKNTLPEWYKLKGYAELEELKSNDDIIIASIEQSMCEKIDNKYLENIMSFPTIKHIKDNEVHEYNDERNASAFSKWIKSLISQNGGGEFKHYNSLLIRKTKSQEKPTTVNHKSRRKRKPKNNKYKKSTKKSKSRRRKVTNRRRRKTRIIKKVRFAT